MSDVEQSLRKEIESLREEQRTRASRYELAEQDMRNIRSKLDNQIDTFTRIHQYGQMAFRLKSADELHSIIAEGVVNIFQLEVGGIFRLDLSGDSLTLLGGCNLDVTDEPLSLALSREWIARQGLWSFADHKAFWESPVPEDSPLCALDLVHAIYMPMFNIDKELRGLILGGVTKASKAFYDFMPQEMQSSFMVYGQQMNGIFNNADAIRRAENARMAKSQFFANLSHEMRTPMNAIIGMVQIAGRSHTLEELRKCIGQIGISSRHLLSLINDVLDISKIEEGKLSLAEEPFTLSDMVENLLISINHKTAEKQQEFSVVYKGISSNRFLGDSMRLSQVLLNLLSNAVKFTPQEGSVCLEIEEYSRDADKVLLNFSVSDTGIGISDEFRNRIFSPFEQADGGISRQYGGTGLGLAISQRIVELMGSEIKVESEPGKGSRFYFSAWLKPGGGAEETMAAATEEYGAPDFSGINILIVDDVEINREIVRAFLDDTGAGLESAVNGLEAVQMFAASPPGYYNLILMDMQMPVMDGCTATREIRASQHPDAKTVMILAMTANVFKEDVQEVVRAGMNGHIGKPVEYDCMIAILRQIFDRAAARKISN